MGGNLRPVSEIEYLQQLAVSHLATRILLSGLQLAVFEQIGDEAKTAEEIAKRTNASSRGIRILLDCLVSFHLLTKSEQRYSLNSISRRYLRKSSPDYMGHLWEDEGSLPAWDRLNEAIRSGKPARKKGNAVQEAASFLPLAQSLHVVHWESAKRAARMIGARNDNEMKVLDVACGSGVWGIAIAQTYPQSKITAQDFPEILEITKAYAKQHGVEKQFQYVPGDLRTIDFGESNFDLAILGNIVHSEGERFSRELFRRIHRTLKDTGRMIIVDIIPDEERTGPQSSLLVALAMLMDTEEGDLFTLSEYRNWLVEAGFTQIDTANIRLHSPMIIAHK
jgi:ubiquinone/menaquinone biosynthesis C-methylase UbiE